MWVVLGVSVLLAWIVGHFTSKALRNGGNLRRWFVSVSSGFLALVIVGAVSFGLAETMAQAPLVQDYPEYAERQSREEDARADARVAERGETRSRDPAVQACADIYRFNTNSTNPDEWEQTHDVGAGRKRAARRLDGSPVLHEGQQVYSVVIPRNGESVSFDRNGISREGSGCQIYQDPDSGAWRSPYGL